MTYKKIILGLVVILVLIGVVAFLQYKRNPSTGYYRTYAECVSATQLPCNFYYVGDLGHEWRPSSYLTQDECDKAVQQVGRTCLVPPGNFRETRWISSADLGQAGRENSASTSSQSIGQQKSTASDISVQDLVAYFNSKFSCEAPKINTGKTCFDNNFKAIDPIGGEYDNPVYELVDFTGDGKLDAIITIYYSGTGGMHDFHALSTDSNVTGGKSGITEVYFEAGLGSLRGSSNPSFKNGSITFYYQAPNTHAGVNDNPILTETLVWDAGAKTFIKK